MSIYRRTCDQCHNTFKRGLRLTLAVNRVSVLSGEVHWDPVDDEEHFAIFCSPICLISYIAQRLGVENGESTSS
jgi:hypothetical protein